MLGAQDWRGEGWRCWWMQGFEEQGDVSVGTRRAACRPWKVEEKKAGPCAHVVLGQPSWSEAQGAVCVRDLRLLVQISTALVA